MVVGAQIRLSCPDGAVMETLSDDFGDFWFRGLKAGDYELSVSADGYAGFERKKITLDKSLNVGDFDLA